MTEDEYQDRVRQARVELAEWIDRNLDALTPGVAEAELPIVTDFVLAVAVENASDNAGQGFTWIGRLSSANGCYRIFGLLRAVEVAFRQPSMSDDD